MKNPEPTSPDDAPPLPEETTGAFLLPPPLPADLPPPVPDLANHTFSEGPFEIESPRHHGSLILIGLLWLAAALYLITPALTALARDDLPDWTALPQLSWWITHTLLPLLMTWLGISTLIGRRWARTFHLAAAAVGFAGCLLVGGAWVLITIRQAGPQASYLWLPRAALVLFGLLICWAILVFFNRQNLRHTIAEADPTPSWTDEWPAGLQMLAVLGSIGAWMSLHLALTSPFPWWGEWFGAPRSAYAWGAVSACFTLSALLTMARRISGWWFFLIALTTTVAAWSWTVIRPEGKIELQGHHPAWMLSMDFIWLVIALYLACGVFLSSLTPLYQRHSSTDPS
jgi:hypothetical protein